MIQAHKSDCPACGKALKVRLEQVGRMVRCPSCQQPFELQTIKTSATTSLAGMTVEQMPPGSDATSRSLLGSLEKLGRYEIRSVLGEGGFGRVYRAYDPQLDREVALKVPLFGNQDKVRTQRFLTEAKAAGKLQHPCIVPTFDSGQIDGRFYIATAFIEGKPLSDLIRRGKIGMRQAAEWVRDLAEALAYAHQRDIVHRDIKPHNVMIDAQRRPHLLDFGLAKRTNDDSSVTTDGTLLGTPAYMSPEQARGEHTTVGAASDQYSLGVVLYELLTGKKPFDGSPHVVIGLVAGQTPPKPRSIRAQIPADIEAICLKAMSRDPAQRYADCAAFAKDLTCWLEGRSTLARPLSLTEQAIRWVRRHAAVSGLSAAIFVLFAIAVILFVRQSKNDLPRPPIGGGGSAETHPTEPIPNVPSPGKSAATPQTAIAPFNAKAIPRPKSAVAVADWDFALHDGSPSNDGQVVAANNEPAKLHDATGNGNGGQVSFAGGNGPKYVTFPANEGQDGFGIRTGKQFGCFWFPASDNSTRQNKNFSVWMRLQIQQATGSHQIWCCRPNRWAIGLTPEGRILIFATNGFAMFDLLNGNGPDLSGFDGQWVDLGLSFAGDGSDDQPDVFSLYVNGTRTNAVNVVQQLDHWDHFHLGAAQTGLSPAEAIFDRVILYEGVLIADDFPASANDSQTTPTPLIPAENTSWHGWPADAPAPAIAPFNAAEAKEYQEQWAAYLKVPVDYENSIGMKFRLIPPGEYLRGSPAQEIDAALSTAPTEGWKTAFRGEAPRHEVVLTRPFYVAVHETTQENYETQMSVNPSWFSAGGGGKQAVNGIDTRQFPVENLSQIDAAEFCTKLSEREAFAPHYRVEQNEIADLLDGTGYRLLTEAEWEFACRAGTTTSYHSGKTSTQLAAAGWYSGNSGGGPHPVGELTANAFGLFDLHGNVLEWCEDGMNVSAYQEYQLQRAVNPRHPRSNDVASVFRGGDYESSAAACRSATRNCNFMNARTGHQGFRAALSVDAVKQALKDKPPVSITNAGWHGWPADAPKPAVAPFDAVEAQIHQEDWAKYLKVPVEYSNSVGMKFRLIPPGEFLMGSPAGDTDAEKDERPQHKVQLTRPFYLGQTEITQAQWKAVMRTEPWKANYRRRQLGADFPAVFISWNDAMSFCKSLSAKEGKQYQLPAEAEWEYACRGGTETTWYFGDDKSLLGNYAWYDANTIDKPKEDYPHGVAKKLPNPFVLFDMHGNVWEWCLDPMDSGAYAKRGDATQNPVADYNSQQRVLRGGSWMNPPRYTRAANRHGASLEDSHELGPLGGNEETEWQDESDTGFRVVLMLDAVKPKVPSNP